ncbi:MAG: YkgJ family cysteine cluster protein [Betaproteobacteria bacterium]
MVETVYLHIEFKGKNSGWSFNLPFVCNKCGICCTLDDFLMAGEIKAKPQEQPEIHSKLKTLYEKLAELLKEGEEKYEDYTVNTQCPFLRENTCSIYSIRPDGCRQFPNTPFGMLTTNCEALTRFKKQSTALSRGRKNKKTYYFTWESIKHARLTQKQYENCLAKLVKAGATAEELEFSKLLNEN